MDNLTHTLFGWALAKTAFDRTTPRATAALLIGANFPDVDLVTLLDGNISYLKHHRGITHSLPGIVVESFLVATILALAHGLLSKAGPPIRFGMLYVMALIGMVSHFVLDYANSYGIRPFLPFDDRWYAADLVFIVDPWILAFLILGLGLPFLFRLVHQEIGAKSAGYGKSAFVCLALVAIFCSCKFYSHERALQELQNRSYPTGIPLRVGALPEFLNPFGWQGVVETETAYHLTLAGWNILQSNVEKHRVRTLRKSEDVEAVRSATQGDQARIFMDFARYPLLQVNPTTEGYQVTARDLRFDFGSRFRKSFLLSILLDRNHKVISEEFSF